MADTQAAAGDGYVLSWTYDLKDYNQAIDAFRRGKRKRPPQPCQMWVDTSEKAERTKAEFVAAHPRSGINVEVGGKPKRQSTMVLGVSLTGVTTKREIVIGSARAAGSADGTGDSITAEEDAVVSRVLLRQPELMSCYSRVQIYRMVQRGQIEVAMDENSKIEPR